ncbi:MAG: hypothetical protein F6K18_05350 [Okeania sp. SIO2C2]|nr:hypothetical protein [Okeania sp. SIO2C2]
MSQSQPPVNRKRLNQMSKEELVEMLLTQQKLIEKLQKQIDKLEQSQNLDSKNSSKPPSTDLLKKSEKAKPKQESPSSEEKKRRPGGQIGHQGRTRKGFSRIDRIEILQPSVCSQCGQAEFLDEPVVVETQQVAQLVDKPIEIIEYHRHKCQCLRCGTVTSAPCSGDMIPGQDLGLKLASFSGMVGKLWTPGL